MDNKSGQFYYGHAETGHVQWERPTGPPKPKQAAPAAAQEAAPAEPSPAVAPTVAPTAAPTAALAQAQAQPTPAQTQAQAPAAGQAASQAAGQAASSQGEATPGQEQKVQSQASTTPGVAASADTAASGGLMSTLGTVLSYVPVVNLLLPAPAGPPPTDPSADAAASGVWHYLVEYTLLSLPDGMVLAWDKDDIMRLVLAVPRKRFKEYVMAVSRAAVQRRKQAITATTSLQEAEETVAEDKDLAREMTLARQLLALDPRLAKLRHYLVPRHVSEEVFWLQYFTEVRARIGAAVKGVPVKDVLSQRKAFLVAAMVELDTQAAASAAQTAASAAQTASASPAAEVAAPPTAAPPAAGAVAPAPQSS